MDDDGAENLYTAPAIGLLHTKAPATTDCTTAKATPAEFFLSNVATPEETCTLKSPTAGVNSVSNAETNEAMSNPLNHCAHDLGTVFVTAYSLHHLRLLLLLLLLRLRV